MTRYLSKKQEGFFQPCRARVLHRPRTSWQFRGGEGFLVVIQNMLTHEVVAKWKWVRDGDGFWDDEEDRKTKLMYPYTSTKAVAVQTAKREAARRDLPFNLQDDVLKENDALEGPVQICLICKKSAHVHSFEPVVCSECRLNAATGRAARSEKHEWLMHFEDLLPYVSLEWGESFRDLEKEFGKLLVRIAGSASTKGPGYYGSEHDKRRIRGHHGEARYPVKVMLHDAQGEAINELLVFLRKLIDLYEARGEASGSSLLHKLASGDISPVEFGLRRDEAKARSVGSELERLRERRSGD